MLIIKITGGLGNQMFQYTYSKWLEKSLESLCKYDLSFYEDQSGTKIDKRSLEIQKAFHIHLEPATLIELNSIIPKTLLGKIKKKFKQFFLHEKLNYIKENALVEQIYGHDFDMLYIDGHWQSKNYLSELDIHYIFKFRPVRNEVTHFLSNYGKQELVSIHLRRGDYLKLNTYKKIEDDYYSRSIQNLNNQNSHFLVFSDDPDFLSKWPVLKRINYTIASGKDFKDYEELYIMSKCQHNIISNSTFSWWGAMLNKNSNKTVICPKSWYYEPKLEVNLETLIPSEWIKY